MNPFQAFQTKNEFQTIDPQRIGGIFKSGDGVQMSVSSYGTTFKNSLCLKWSFSQPRLPLCSISGGDPWRIGGILLSEDNVQMQVSSFGTTRQLAWNHTRLEWIHFNLVWIHPRLDQTKKSFCKAVFALNGHLPQQDYPFSSISGGGSLENRGHPDIWRWCPDVSFISWKNLTCCMKLYQVRMNSF